MRLYEELVIKVHSICKVDTSNELTEDQEKILSDFQKKFLEGMKPCPHEYLDIINKHWTEMLA